jgi:FHS family glucose/mannose:H+ symporter-like MFS transporter
MVQISNIKELIMNRLLLMGCIGYLLIGLAHVIIGALLPELLAHYSLSYTEGGQLVFVQFSGFLLGVLLVPWMSAKFSKRSTLILALVCLGAAEAAYGLLLPWQWMYGIAFLAGLGFGSIEAIIGTIIIESTPVKKATAMSRLEVCFGVGALLMPLIASWMIDLSWWRISFYIIALISFAVAICFRWMSFGQTNDYLAMKTSGATAAHPSLKYTKSEIYILVFFIFFFLLYVGGEMSIVNFLPTFLIANLKLATSTASLSVTFFWVTMVIGRLFTGLIAERVNYAIFLLWSCLGAVIFMVLFGATSSVWSAFAMIMLVGLMMSGIFAISLLFANYLIPGKTERTTSILIASGGIGGALLPLAVGSIMDHFAAHTAVNFIIGSTMLLFIMSVFAFRLNASQRRQSKAAAPL